MRRGRKRAGASDDEWRTGWGFSGDVLRVVEADFDRRAFRQKQAVAGQLDVPHFVHRHLNEGDVVDQVFHWNPHFVDQNRRVRSIDYALQ